MIVCDRPSVKQSRNQQDKNVHPNRTFLSTENLHLEDFQSRTDFLIVSGSGFGGGLNQGFIKPSQFTLGSSASDRSDRFIYNSNNGNLFFDPDGTGSKSQLLIATFTNKPNLVNNDIFVSA